MSRHVFSEKPPPRGDYILSSTGLTWNVRCATGNGSVRTVADGAPDKTSALATLLSMAEADKADAWETAGRPALLVPRAR